MPDPITTCDGERIMTDEDRAAAILAGIMSTFGECAEVHPEKQLPMAMFILAAIRAGKVPGVVSVESYAAAHEADMAQLRAEVERLRIDRDGLLLVLGWSRRNGPCSEVSMHQAMIAETKEAMEQRSRAEKAEAERDSYHKKACEIADQRDSAIARAEKAEARHAETVALLREARHYPIKEVERYESATAEDLANRIDAHLAACDGKGVGG